MAIEQSKYGKSLNGIDIDVFRLSNTNGMTVEITNYGGTIVSISTPDSKGNFQNVVLGYDSLEDYINGGFFYGALIGRCANRIGGAKFELGGKEYLLNKNDGNNHLHGGFKGFDKVVWEAEVRNRSDFACDDCDDGDSCSNTGECLALSYHSPDGDENYPGNLEVMVLYSLTESNSLIIDYLAYSDKDTVVNLTNHSYFNLSGDARREVLDSEITINADRYTPNSSETCPTGELSDVTGTPFDLRVKKTVGAGINSGHEQIKLFGGFDHNWALNVSGDKPEFAAKLFEPESGRILEVFTTKPGMQVYSANYPDKPVKGKDGAEYRGYCALCFETQYFPNAVNIKSFPSPVLRAEQEYRHRTVFKFSTI